MQANRGQPREGNEDREKCSRLRRVQAADLDWHSPDRPRLIGRASALAPQQVRAERDQPAEFGKNA